MFQNQRGGTEATGDARIPRISLTSRHVVTALGSQTVSMNRGTPGTTKIGDLAIGSGARRMAPIPRNMSFSRGAMWRAQCRPMTANNQQAE